jgi:hypothetical protein
LIIQKVLMPNKKTNWRGSQFVKATTILYFLNHVLHKCRRTLWGRAPNIFHIYIYIYIYINLKLNFGSKKNRSRILLQHLTQIVSNE